MAKQRESRAEGPARTSDIEALAATIYAARIATGRTPEFVAGQALELARVFYRVCDEQNKGGSPPAPV